MKYFAHSTFLVALLMTLLTSCSPKQSSSNSLQLIAGKYFSMRQQSPTQYVGIVKLKTESLLATAGSENGKLVM